MLSLSEFCKLCYRTGCKLCYQAIHINRPQVTNLLSLMTLAQNLPHVIATNVITVCKGIIPEKNKRLQTARTCVVKGINILRRV